MGQRAAFENHDPTGHTITRYHVLGREHSAEGAWVGADVSVHVPPVGKFVGNIMTKQAFLDEGVAAAVLQPECFTPAMFASTLEHRPAYVVNDRELSDAVLDRVLTGEVHERLADALFYDGPTSNQSR